MQRSFIVKVKRKNNDKCTTYTFPLACIASILSNMVGCKFFYTKGQGCCYPTFEHAKISHWHVCVCVCVCVCVFNEGKDTTAMHCGM